MTDVILSYKKGDSALYIFGQSERAKQFLSRYFCYDAVPVSTGIVLTEALKSAGLTWKLAT